MIDAWASEEVVKNSLFEKEGYLKPYKMKYFDIPLIISNSKEGMEFMEALGRADDQSIFGRASVQSIIQIHWNFW